jgi:hypothetical protein
MAHRYFTLFTRKMKRQFIKKGALYQTMASVEDQVARAGNRCSILLIIRQKALVFFQHAWHKESKLDTQHVLG